LVRPECWGSCWNIGQTELASPAVAGRALDPSKASEISKSLLHRVFTRVITILHLCLWEKAVVLGRLRGGLSR
jgi:hypothetical protein